MRYAYWLASAGLLAFVLAGVIMFFLVEVAADDTPNDGVTQLPQSQTEKWQPPPMPVPASFADLDLDPKLVARLEQEWGVRLLGVRLAASNYMLDFRFHVIDAQKALPLFDSRIKPYVLVERSNAKLPIPIGAKVGSFRTTNRGKNITSGRNYFMMFGNPDQHVRPGQLVTVVIGEFKVEHIPVS